MLTGMGPLGRKWSDPDTTDPAPVVDAEALKKELAARLSSTDKKYGGLPNLASFLAAAAGGELWRAPGRPGRRWHTGTCPARSPTAVNPPRSRSVGAESPSTPTRGLISPAGSGRCADRRRCVDAYLCLARPPHHYPCSAPGPPGFHCWDTRWRSPRIR